MDASTALLRIAQGAMSNVVKHSGADHARIILAETDDGGVRLSVADDGSGFDLQVMQASNPSRDSFGIRAIEERVLQLGGAMEIDSAPGHGTVLSATLPREAV